MDSEEFDDLFAPLESLMAQEIEDCIDWLASNLSRYFPGIGLEPYDATEWRKALHITIPAQCSYTVHEVEDQAFAWRDKLFFDKDVLIGLRISRERSED